MGAVRVWRSVRRADGPAAYAVVAVNLLLCPVLLAMMTGGVLGFEATTREEELAAQALGARIFGCWLVGGLVVFSALGMARSLVGHLATLLLTPAVLLSVLFLL